MQPKERVRLAAQHIQPDRVPLFYRDVPEVQQKLCRTFGLNTREELLEYLEIDFRWVGPEYIGPALEDEQTGIKRDIWGCSYKYTEVPSGGGYWEIISHPLEQCSDPKELDDYPWPKLEWFDFSKLSAQCDKYADYAIMTDPGFASPSLLQSPIQTLLGDEKAFMDMMLNRPLFERLIEKILEFQLAFIDKMLSAAEGKIDFFRVGDDFGTQNDLLISPSLWKQLIETPLKAMFDVAKKHNALCYLHSCGSVRKLIPYFIEIGVDVLDPLQVTAKDMVPAELKREFGDKICFSGGVDEQQLLPNGSTDDVRQAVFRLLDDMAKGGGFFIGPTHNFQFDIPPENILAMYEAAKDWKG